MTTQQQSFPGMESVVQNAIDEWRESKRECRRTREVRDMKHAALLALMAEHNLPEFPFIDELTGKKRRIRIETKTKAKDENQPRERDVEDEFDVTDTDDGADVIADKSDGKVEKRRVSRASVQSEIDPFNQIRGLVEEAQSRQGKETIQ